jgi:hypothetical protein
LLVYRTSLFQRIKGFTRFLDDESERLVFALCKRLLNVDLRTRHLYDDMLNNPLRGTPVCHGFDSSHALFSFVPVSTHRTECRPLLFGSGVIRAAHELGYLGVRYQLSWGALSVILGGAISYLGGRYQYTMDIPFHGGDKSRAATR